MHSSRVESSREKAVLSSVRQPHSTRKVESIRVQGNGEGKGAERQMFSAADGIGNVRVPSGGIRDGRVLFSPLFSPLLASSQLLFH